MRNLAEIISSAKDGNIPTHEECFWAMLALSGKLYFAKKDLESVAEYVDKDKDNKIPIGIKLRCPSHEKVYSEHFQFMKKSPKEWLGDSGNPFTEENQKFMETGKKIIENATGLKL